MPSADFCSAVSPPFDSLSRRSDTEQISWGKLNCLPCTVAGCTLRTLDGYGLRGNLSARPTLACALYPVFVHRLERLLYASFRPRLTAIALAFSLVLPGRPGEFHPESPTDPDVNLSIHPARATQRRLPPSITTGSSSGFTR